MRQRFQRNKRYRMSLAAGFLVLLLCLAGCNTKDMNSVTAQASGQESQEQALGSLNLHYLDVGQGNAVLAESQGHYMLIDGGARKASSFIVSYLEKQGVKELDYLLISHFDEDHLAGAIGALHKFPVKQLITPDYETDSSIYQSYAEVVQEKQYQAVHPKVGDEFTFGTATFRIISPTVYGHEDENQDSVGIVLKNGENEFFIGGDIGLESEKEILNEGIDIQADVMLMNHHGSHVSNDFLHAVNPDYAVISCGADNRYGHPRQDTVELLKKEQIPLFRTDKQGTIDISSNGTDITFAQKPCNDYTPGTRGSDSQQEEAAGSMENARPEDCDYVLNAHTKKIHLPECASVKTMDEDNKEYYKGDKQALLDNGYTACGNCKP